MPEAGGLSEPGFAFAAILPTARWRSYHALCSGYLILHGSRFDNAIPIPLNCDGTVELYLISQFGESVLIRGERIILDLMDEAEYVEEFPGES